MSTAEQLNTVGNKLTKALLWLENSSVLDVNDMIRVTERAVYLAAMRLAYGNQSKAAKALGVSRGTLRKKLLLYFGTTRVGRFDSGDCDA
jgi:DNA-binding protein Fis